MFCQSFLDHRARVPSARACDTSACRVVFHRSSWRNTTCGAPHPPLPLHSMRPSLWPSSWTFFVHSGSSFKPPATGWVGVCNKLTAFFLRHESKPLILGSLPQLLQSLWPRLATGPPCHHQHFSYRFTGGQQEIYFLQVPAANFLSTLCS